MSQRSKQPSLRRPSKSVARIGWALAPPLSAESSWPCSSPPGRPGPSAAVLVLGVATLIGVQSWRLAVFLALAYLPVEGLLWVALYPHTAPAALAKDFLFVIPAYIGFFYWCMKSKRNFVFPGFPLLAVVLLAGLVIVEIFNPLLSRCWWASSGRRSGSFTSRWRSSVTS